MPDLFQEGLQPMTQPLPLDVRFLKRFARRLHQAGVPAHQLEGMIRVLSGKLGYQCDIWSSPTAVFMSLRQQDDDDDNQPVPMQLIRLQPGSTNLADTAELYRLAEKVLEGELSLVEADQRLRLPRVSDLFPPWLKLLSAALVSGAFAMMLAASWQGGIVAALAGFLVAVLYANAGKALRAGGMEAIAAVLVTVMTYAFNQVLTSIEPASIIMSGLIVLMPGLSLTIAVTELSTDHLTSGSARLAGALITLLKLALGVLIGTVISDWLNWDAKGSVSLAASMPPDWIQWPALLVAALGFAVIFNVRRRDFHLAVMAAVAGYGVSRLGVMIGGTEFGVMLAALVVGVLGNLLGRALRRPASLIRVPGIILLVPGALGYRTVTNVLLNGTPNPQETALLVAMLVVSLVGGLLIGNTIVPPRRYL